MKLQFVILTHDHPHLHWDLMLEDESVLLTWRLESKPSGNSEIIPADPLPSHRKDYLTYEGPVSHNRGTVAQLDAGVFEWTNRTEDCLEFNLSGQKLRGVAFLIRHGEGDWTFQFEASEK